MTKNATDMSAYIFIPLHLLLLIVLLILSSRLLGYLLGYVLSALTKYKVKIGSVTLWSVCDIVVRRPDLRVTITHISLVNQFTSSSKRLFGLFLGDVKVEAGSLTRLLSNRHSDIRSPPARRHKQSFKVPSFIYYLVQRLHFSVRSVGIQVEDEDVSIAVYLSTGANLVSCTDVQNFVSTHLILDDIQIKIRETGSGTAATTYLNTSFGFKVDLLISTAPNSSSLNPVEHVRVGIKPCSIIIYEGVLDVIKRLHARIKPNTVANVTRQKEGTLTRVHKLLPYLPKVTKLCVDNVSCSISDIEQTRNMSFKLERLKEKGTHEVDNVSETLNLNKLEIFINHTPCINLSSVKITPLTITNITPDGCDISVTTLLEVPKLQWFNTELITWLTTLPLPPSATPSGVEGSGRPPNITITSTIELIDLSVHMFEDSKTMKKIISLLLPRFNFHHSVGGETRSVGMECKALQLELPLQKQNLKKKIKCAPNTHVWGDVVFVKTLTFKLQETVGALNLHVDIQNVVLEWSYHLSDLIMEIMPQFITLIPAPSTRPAAPAAARSINVDSRVEKLNVFLLSDDPGEVCTLLHVQQIEYVSSGERLELCVEDMYIHLLESLQELYLCNIELDTTDMMLSCKRGSLVRGAGGCDSVTLCAVSLYWEPTQHRVLEVCYRKTKGALFCIRDLLLYKRQATRAAASVTTKQRNIDITVSLETETFLHFQTSPTNQIVLHATPLTVHVLDDTLTVRIQEHFSLIMDSHKILRIQNVRLWGGPQGDVQLNTTREACPNFAPSNRAWYLEADQLKVLFPYRYQADGTTFAMAVDQAQNCYRMLKAIHRTPRLASDTEPLYADCRLVIRLLMIEFEDFAFDQKISHNYMIMREARMETYEKLSNNSELETGDLNLSAMDDQAFKEHDSIWDTYYSLQKQFKDMNAGHGEEEDVKVTTFFLSHLDLCVCADESLNGHDNVVAAIDELDYDTVVPSHLRFTTLWGREVNGTATEFYMSLRNFPSKLWTMNQVSVKGLVCGAEAVSPNHAIRRTRVQLHQPWKHFELARGMVPLKLFYNLHFDMEQSEMCWGPCLEPTYQFFGQCMDKVTKKSRDPSPILPFWDKARLLFRGDITYTSKVYTCKLLSEREPANDAEYLSICSKGLVARWTNGCLCLDGDTVIKNSTESKYGECKIVTLPHLNVLVKMIWKTINNDPNDHWLVAPYDRDSPEYLKLRVDDEVWDSYAAFRSKWLDLDISLNFDKSEDDSGRCPKVNVYSHTFKWLRSWATVMGTVSRPLFKGSYWKNFKPPKKKLTRHYRKIHFRTELEHVELEIWSSYRKRAGAKLTIESGKLQMTQKLQLVRWEPVPMRDETGEIYEVELKRRPQCVWSTESCSAMVNSIQGTLKGTLDNLSDSEVEATGAPPEHFLCSIRHVEYRQRDDKTSSSDSLHSNHSRDSKLYTHWVNISDVKASLNLDTRSLILTFLEQYESSRALSCDLSAEALKTVNLENNSFSARKSSKSLTQYEKSPNQSNDDLLSQWDPDTITIVTVDDRSHQSREKLAGEQACSDYDIKSRQWSIQMTNGQMAVQGPDLKGFIILTTGKCQVLGSEHKPVLRGGEFFSKFSWVCIVEHVQYFATVDEASECDIPWIDENIINVRTKRTNSSCDGELSSDNLFLEEPAEESLKSIVREVYRQDTKDSVTQLQRIVSRCGCLLSFATYGTQPLEEFTGSTDDLQFGYSQHSASELLSAFSLRHKSLEVSTNSHQYKMIIDCVNNLILRTEGSKRSSKARLQHAIRLMESGEFKARDDILKLQDQVRELLRMIKDSERRLYELRHEINCMEKEHVIQDLTHLKEELSKYRIQLRLTISAFKEYMTNNDAIQETVEEQVEVRKSDICIDEAKWSLAAECGQIPIMEVTIRDNFIYSRTVFNTCSDTNLDFSSRHQITLGYFAVKNLQNKCEFRDVLFPKNHTSQEDTWNRNARLCLRVFLSQRNKPVGGININDHLEINLVPLVLNFETALWREIQKFFLGRVRPDTDDLQDYEPDMDAADSSSIHPLNWEEMQGNKRPGKKSNRGFGSRKSKSTADPTKAIDEMAARSAKKFFNFVKIQEIPILISYKGGRISVREKMVQFPRIELSEQAFTWKELCLEIKKKSTPQIALSLGKMSKQKYAHQMPAALQLLDNPSSNASIDEDSRDQYIYKALMGATDDQPAPKKKKGFMTDLIRKKSKKIDKNIVIPSRPTNAPDESFAKECANPGEWEDNSLGERINELAAMSDETNLDFESANNENSQNLKNQLG